MKNDNTIIPKFQVVIGDVPCSRERPLLIYCVYIRSEVSLIVERGFLL